uniref:Uncharacterized protein n=1 Tax=Anguilla anguilla TaxID=7936 RepID=A0A0E9QIE0_ANGAN
MRQSVFHN